MVFKWCASILAVLLLTIATIGAIDNYTVNVANNDKYGAILTNETFFTLYRYLSDPQNKDISTCNGDCSKIWPPFYAPNLTVNPDLRSKDFSVITRENGEKQLTYKGWPLYLYTGDTKPIQTNGQGLQGLWFVVQYKNLTR